MTDPTPPLSFAVLLGSVRRDRMGIRAAKLVMDALKARGGRIGRRTVAKYRDRLGILPARMRKRL